MISLSPGLSTIMHIGIIAYKKAGGFMVNFKGGQPAIAVPQKDTAWKVRKKIILSAIIVELVFFVMMASLCAVLVLGFTSDQSNFKLLERVAQLLT